MNVCDFTKADFQFTKKEKLFTYIYFPQTARLFDEVEIAFGSNTNLLMF